jgi:hypothetical protein
MNIDCRLLERGEQVTRAIQFESVSVISPEPSSGTPSVPVFRQQKSSMTSAVVPGRPTVVGILDDVATNRRYGIEVTAPKVN